MSYTSLGFFILVAACTCAYYLVKRSRRWICLLLFSALYYAAAGPALLIFILFAAFTTWVGAGYAARQKRAAVAIPLLLDFGVLAYLKYSPFVVSLLNLLPGIDLGLPRTLLPLGISFYTFQSAGYLLDVYWKRCEAEESFAKYLLFVGFFPQLMQGPIGRCGTLMPQLKDGNAFDMMHIRRGLLRICWGLFKKMLIADNAALYVNRIFDDYLSLHAFGFQGVLMYSVQLYMDFSGGIDIALGIAELLGVRLDENFRQPFFAKDLTDFWHRWHITLGTWMKDYLFYPVSLSGWMGTLRRAARKRFGKETGRAMAVGVANLIVFLAVGVWHGPAWHFLAYGLYNGLIISVSGLMTGTFRRLKKTLGVSDSMPAFRAFQILRTFLIVNLSWFLDRSGSVRQALIMLRDAFRGSFFSLTVIRAGDADYCLRHFLPIVIGCAVVLLVSIFKERKKDVLSFAAKLPLWVIPAAYAAVLIAAALYGNKDSGGFIYANF